VREDLAGVLDEEGQKFELGGSQAKLARRALIIADVHQAGGEIDRYGPRADLF
jgi:hypothetical protein